LRNKVSIGVLITAFGLTSLLGSMPMANAKNNLLKPKEAFLHAAPQGAALVVSKAKSESVLKKYENAHSLTDSQLVELLKAVGFEGKALKTAWAVAKAESNGRPLAFNGNTKTGDSSYGIFQVNMLGALGPDRRDRYDLDFNAALFNPVMNADIVYRMTKAGTDWSSWSSYNKGAHYKWLDRFPNH
jgi:hypothetical protein